MIQCTSAHRSRAIHVLLYVPHIYFFYRSVYGIKSYWSRGIGFGAMCLRAKYVIKYKEGIGREHLITLEDFRHSHRLTFRLSQILVILVPRIAPCLRHV